MSGGGHAPQFAVRRGTVTKSGPLKTYHLKSDVGNAAEFGFCGECGSPIYKTTALAPNLIFFFTGSLDDPTRSVLANKVYENSRQSWDQS